MDPIQAIADQAEPVSPQEQERLSAAMGLASMVQKRFLDAASYRSQCGISDAMVKAKRAQDGEPITGVHGDPEIPLVLNITSTITRGITALIRDAINATAEGLFTVKATPSPDLPPEIEAEIGRQVSVTAQTMLGVGLSVDDDLSMDAALSLYGAARDEQNRIAKVNATELTTMIRDKFGQNGWRKALDEGLYDMVCNVAMVIKFPSTMVKRVKSWGPDGRLVWKDTVVRAVERIPPWQFYPSRGAADPHTADYVIEVRTARAHDLYALASEPGYNPTEIMRVLAQYPNGYKAMNSDGTAVVFSDKLDMPANNQTVGEYEILVMSGLVSGVALQQMGIDLSDTARDYEASVAVIGNCCIMALLNPDPHGLRPYEVVSYDPNPDCIWGNGSPTTRLFDVQRAITSAYVGWIGDMMLAGLHIELDPNRLHADDRIDPNQLRARTVRIVKPDMSGSTVPQRAYNIFSVDPHSEKFRATIADLESKAYDIVGVPRMAFGQTTGAGTIGRTADGIKTLLNQTLKVLKNVLTTFERKLVEPVVQREVDHYLMYDNELQLRGDVNVQALGLTGLVEQAERVDELEWALQSIGPLVDKIDPETGRPLLPVAAIRLLLKKIFDAKGIDTTGIFPSELESMAQPPMPSQPLNQFAAAKPGTALAASQQAPLGPSNGV